MSEIRPFGVDAALLETARAIASDAIEVWGDLSEHEWKMFRERGIWNDHVAVQAALSALAHSVREDNAALAEDNRKRVASLSPPPSKGEERLARNQVEYIAAEQEARSATTEVK